MARNTTGLRRGGPGRPKGSRNKLPRSLKASIRDIFQEIADKDPGMIKAALVKGIRAKPPQSFAYLQLAAAYIDGKPEAKMNISGHLTGPAIVIVPPEDGE